MHAALSGASEHAGPSTNGAAAARSTLEHVPPADRVLFVSMEYVKRLHSRYTHGHIHAALFAYFSSIGCVRAGCRV